MCKQGALKAPVAVIGCTHKGMHKTRTTLKTSRKTSRLGRCGLKSSPDRDGESSVATVVGCCYWMRLRRPPPWG